MSNPTTTPQKRLGYFSRLLDDVPAGERYRLVTEQIVHAEALGFDSAWVAQHHFHENEGGLPSPLVFLAHVAQRAQRIRLGTGVVTLTEPHATCDMSVQVMADAPPASDSQGFRVSEVVTRQQEMQSLLDKLAGMVGKYFLPEMAGVRVTLVQPSGTAYLIDGARQQPLPWQDGQLLLRNEQLADFAAGRLQLAGEILRLTPWLHKG